MLSETERIHRTEGNPQPRFVSDPFESFLAKLATQLPDVRAETLDREMVARLHGLTLALGVDWSGLIELGGDEDQVRIRRSHPIPSSSRKERSDGRRFPWLARALRTGEVSRLSHVPDDPRADVAEERRFLAAEGLESLLTVPISGAGYPRYALAVGTSRGPGRWERKLVERLRIAGAVLLRDLDRQRSASILDRATAEIRELRERLASETRMAPESSLGVEDSPDIVGRSAALRTVLQRARQVASTEASVLLLGETGTGKELFAQAIHEASTRRARPLVKVNCAALPATLIETELFGHEKGAFTGALSRKMGRFEQAHGGTLFLDEIGDLPLELQGKLLRVLQAGEFERLGSSRTNRVDVRVVAATNRDLEAGMRDGTFREDLFFRLGVFPIRIPALRERPEDIRYLVSYFLTEKRRRLGKHVTAVPDSVMKRLEEYAWPGNVRELENTVERAMILSSGTTLQLEGAFMPTGLSGGLVAVSDSLEDRERAHILDVLERCGWKVKGKGNAAERLNLNPSTLRFRMRKLGIERSARHKSDRRRVFER